MGTTQLLNTREAAALLRVQWRTLDKWRSNKRYGLRFVKIGRKVFYSPQDIETFIASRTQSGLPETPRRRRAR